MSHSSIRTCFRAAFSFRAVQKIKGRTQKVPLRTVADQWMPRDIVDRPKASFGAPLRAWVSNELGPVDDVLLDGRLVSSGVPAPPAGSSGCCSISAAVGGPVQTVMAAAVDGAVV